MHINNLIFPYDYIILGILIVVVIFCFWKGFIRSLLSLLTWVGSILLTLYTYESLSGFFTKQILNIKIFQNYEYFTNIISIIISIPLIFLISLFILKRVRKFLSTDLDKQILGIIFDKLFGFFYGILFTYIILSSCIFFLENFELIPLNNWLKNNSYIINKVDNFNKNIIDISNPINDLQENQL